MHTHRTPGMARVAFAAAAILLTTSGCSLLDGDDEASSATPSTIVAPKLVELTALEAILPQAGDIGPEFALGEPEWWGGDDEDGGDDDSEDSEFDDAMDECPGAEQAFEAPLEHFDVATAPTRDFAAPDGRGFGVIASSDADRSVGPVERAELVEAMEVLSLCPTASIVDDETGLQMNITFDGRMVDGYGEWATEISMRMTMLHENLPQPAMVDLTFLYFGVGSVTIGVFTVDGLQEGSAFVTEADMGRRDAVATNLALMAAALQMEAAPEATTPDGAAT